MSLALEAEAEELIRMAKKLLPTVQRGAPQAAELAQQLQRTSIMLQSYKATEFSADIPTLTLLAAQIALLTFGPMSPEVEPYECDVYYYRSFKSPIVGLYDSFKESSCGKGYASR